MNSCQLYYQSNFNEEEKDIAINILQYFEQIILTPPGNEPVPSWKHRTRGGFDTHGKTMPIQRGKFGLRCDWFYYKDKDGNNKKELRKTLVFRRLSKNKRKFGVVRVNELEIKENNNFEDWDSPPELLTDSRCLCNVHIGGIKVQWKEKQPKLTLWKEYLEQVKHLEC